MLHIPRLSLVPAIEEFEKILGRSIEGQACYRREIPTIEDMVKALHLKDEEISPLQESRGICWNKVDLTQTSEE
jgi:hypothetical protein